MWWAHHWARQLTQLGHEVQLIPPAYVKPFVKRQKNDAIDGSPTTYRWKCAAIKKVRCLQPVVLVLGGSGDLDSAEIGKWPYLHEKMQRNQVATPERSK